MPFHFAEYGLNDSWLRIQFFIPADHLSVPFTVWQKTMTPRAAQRTRNPRKKAGDFPGSGLAAIPGKSPAHDAVARRAAGG